MSCKICGRGACAYSFHSLAQQEQYDKYCDLDERELIAECIDKENEIKDLEFRVLELELTIERMEATK